MTRALVFLGALMLVAIGCGTPSAGSCSMTTSAGMQCVDYGQGFTADQARSACSMGTYSAGACTATDRVGRCTITATAGGSTASSVVNFYPPVTVEIGMMACTTGGVAGATAVW